MKITVDRSTWGRGEQNGLLLNPHSGRRCCIGFVCQQIGIHDERLKSFGIVHDLSGEAKDLFEQHFPDCGDADLDKAYAMNDETNTDSLREKILTQWGKPVGIEFEFVNGSNERLGCPSCGSRSGNEHQCHVCRRGYP